jgi:hypothetical protein
LGGTKVLDTFRAIDIVRTLKFVDQQLDEQNASGCAIRINSGDILMMDP